MLNKLVLSSKVPYADSSTPIEEAYNYSVKVLNSSFIQSLSDIMPSGSVLQSINDEDVFKSQVGVNWVKIGSSLIGGITVNIFQKIN